eukprot:GFUD01037014.1.p1 GENE.GFUD01037014.1~~GFUD01037014.1.p1  ORF type:complete len:397 (+),score=114.31 GFUD01037014.1:80-1270(+)
MDNTELQSYAEQYFSSSNFLNKKILEDIANVRESYEEAWNGLEEKEKEQVINEHIIFPEVMIQHAKSQDQAKHQPSSFPRLKIRTGQKFIVEEGNSSQSDRNGTYSYRDEHSSPFGWKTRSQQNLNFDIYNSTETSSNSTDGLDVVTARRSTILSCPFGQYTRVPKVSKPVSIPVVPELPESKKKESEFPKDISEVTSLVSSIVIENENNIVLDFSAPVTTTIEDYYEGSSICSTINSPAPSTPISARGESSSLISKVRDKTASLKRSLTPTMKRKKSTTSMDTLSTTATECDSPDQTPTRICPRSSPNRVMKPACPPPPPPVARPVAPPPPPPTTNIEIKVKIVPPVPPQRDPATRISTFVSDVADSNATEEDQTSDPPEKPQIPKTGFDFLDEW